MGRSVITLVLNLKSLGPDLPPIHPMDGGIGTHRGVIRHEPEAFALSGVLIHVDLGRDDITKR